jgi:NAD(P)H dehydrogenase (quinone)
MVATSEGTRVLVLFYSRFGVVRELAERIAEGARRVKGTSVELLEIEEKPVEQLRPDESVEEMELRRATIVDKLATADVLVVGSPAYFGSIASPVKRLFEESAVAGNPPVHDRSRPWYGHLFRDKVGAAFTASATPHGGNEETLHSILTMFMHLGMVIVTPGQHEPILEEDTAPYGATAIAGADGTAVPTEHEQDEARSLGQRTAEIATWLRLGRLEWEKWHGEAAPKLPTYLDEVKGQSFLQPRR